MKIRGLIVAVISVWAALVLTAGLSLKAQAPELSEIERTKVELLRVRGEYAKLLAQYDGCKAEVGAAFNALGRLRAAAASTELTAEEASLKATVEAGHPGFEWNPKTGAFTAKPPEQPKPPEAPHAKQ